MYRVLSLQICCLPNVMSAFRVELVDILNKIFVKVSNTQYKNKTISHLENDDSTEAMFYRVLYVPRQQWCSLHQLRCDTLQWSGWGVRGGNRYHLLAAIPTLQYTINGPWAAKQYTPKFCKLMRSMHRDIDTNRTSIELCRVEHCQGKGKIFPLYHGLLFNVVFAVGF